MIKFRAPYLVFFVRICLFLLAFATVAACDLVEPTTPTPPVDEPEPEPEPEVVGVTRLQIQGVGVYGVRKEFDENGNSSLVVTDSLKQTVRFGVYAFADTLQTCPPEADRCRIEILGAPQRAEVVLDQDVTVRGQVRPAGTDLFDHFDAFEQDWLLGTFAWPTPLFHVGFDAAEVEIPEGEIGLTVRWIRDATTFETTRTLVYER